MGCPQSLSNWGPVKQWNVGTLPSQSYHISGIRHALLHRRYRLDF